MKKSKNRSVIFLKDLAPRADVQGGAAKRVFGAPPVADAGGRSHEAPTDVARPASPRPPGARGRKKTSK